VRRHPILVDMTLRFKATVVFILILLLAFFYAFFKDLFYKGTVRLNYPSEKTFPVRGIDVSHHQGDIDWKKIATQNIDFAYIKATEGGDFRDEDFKTNWNAAKSVGIVPGAYHFFTLCKSGAEQASNFLNYMGTPSASALPPAVDLEFGGNCKARPSDTELQKELNVFIDTVQAAWGCPVVLYSTSDFYEAYLKNTFKNNPLWIRDIYREPNKKIYGQWQFWQYANRGKLDGIKGFVDFNVWHADQNKFDAFLNCTE
jgi:lysozyme